jgi:hypothetical protein
VRLKILKNSPRISKLTLSVIVVRFSPENTYGAARASTRFGKPIIIYPTTLERFGLRQRH